MKRYKVTSYNPNGGTSLPVYIDALTKEQALIFAQEHLYILAAGIKSLYPHEISDSQVEENRLKYSGYIIRQHSPMQEIFEYEK